MAKRFTDTDKWKKPFVRGLQGTYKLLWFYICDDCDHAGIWQVDLEVTRLRVGPDVDLDLAIEYFGKKIVVFDGGAKWFIPSFLDFQYPSGLSLNNKAHGGVIKILEKYDLLHHIIKPLKRTLQGSKVTESDKDKDKEEKGGTGEKEGKAIGIETVSLAAREVWDNARWKEAIFMGHGIDENQLKQWMAQFNSSICNDIFYGFDAAKYMKLFGGWLNKQKSKGYKLPENQSNGLSNLKKLQS